MAKLTHAESRRLYSWWWDSHISPKNSKWLQENLTDMDIKVKAMIKLLEQDADSFARRAEMYYKKRPELMKLVEEFYRAYRALAERYDHATGALRQAHRTMAEAFPNQIPFVLPDESPTGSSKMPRPIQALFDSDDSPKDASHVPSQFHDIKNGAYSEENKEITSKKGLKQLNDMFGSGEEVHSLKETISKLESEKEAALLQHRLSLERISDMETEISSCQDELKKLNDEILIVVSKLKSADERCLLLDKANQSLQLELDTFKQRAKEQREELNKKQEELERLNISIQDQQAEMAHMSQSQEEAKILALEVQRGIEKLKDMELSKLGLEEEIQKLTEDNCRLNEQNIASAFKIINLQGEIILLKDSKAKLEDEVGLHVEEKKVLQQELTCLKEDKHDLEERHCWLTEKIEAVNMNVESLQATVKELQERCKKHEDEKVVHLESLKHLEEISEKNVVLETSLLDANVEIEGSREKIKTLKESCGSLNDMVSIHRSEKVKLVSLVESIAREMEKISERNTVLENSLSDVNVELEGLRVKSKVLEESCQSLYAQNSSLISEKCSLVSQIERTIQNLENLETGYAELEVKHSNLEREKDLPLRRIMELQDSFKREKEEYETLITSIILSSKSREEELEVELHKIIDAQIENFILQRCLRDTNENNSILSAACWKHLEALECGEKLISELKHELLAREKKLTTSLVRNENLKEGIQLMLRELCVDKDRKSLDGIKDEILLQLTLREIRDLLNSISDAHDENHHLLLEKSVLITIIEQFGLNVMDLMMEKIALERESKTKTDILSVLQSKELELLELNEQLRQDAQASDQRKEALQGEICKLLEENQSLSKKIYHSREKEDNLEEENSVILAEVMTVEYLYLIFRSSTTEKALELQLLRNDLAFLHGKLAAVEAENVQLKEMVVNLERCKEFEDELNTTRNVCKQLNLEIESGKDRLAQKDIELLQANHQLLSIQQENTEMCRNLEDLQLDLESLHKEVEVHKTKEEHLIYDLQKGEDEVKSCEAEIAALLNDMHITTVDAVVFKEKLFELLITCGICCMVQRETLHEEITVRNVNVNELREKLASMEGENVGLKKELNAYLLLITALWDDITSLEEHTLLLANHRAANRSEKQENLSTHVQQSKGSQEPSENHSAALPAGILELQKLRAKVQALQKAVVDAESLVQQEMFESNANFEVSMNEIDVQTSKDIVMQLEKSDEPGTSLDLQKGDVGIPEVKYEEMMKDIQLDLVSSSPQYGNDVGSCGTSKIEKPGTGDQFFESWETTERDRNNSSVHEIEYQINAVEEEKTEYPSCELVSEKEVSIDKLELPKKVTEYHQDLNSETIERLSTNAQRLSVLQTSVQELRRNMESSETSNGAASLEFNTVKAQLKEAEGAILQLIDTNRNLTEKAKEVSPSTDRVIVEQNGKRNKIIRQISERAQRGSETIGRLEFDLQKIKEDRVNRRAADEARRRVLLKDYLYGTDDSRRQRRRRSFGCMRPRTKD